MSFLQNKKTLAGLLVLIGFFAALAIIPAFFEFPTDGLDYVGTEEFSFQQLIAGITESFNLGVADDYDFLGLGPVFGTVLSALLGILLIAVLFGIPFLIIRTIRKKKNQDELTS